MESVIFHRQQSKEPTFEDRLQALRAAGFEAERLPDGRVRVTREGCAAVISPAGSIEIAGWGLNGEIGLLVDGGYQKFWQAGNKKIPALAEQLMALHDFEEDLREGLGLISEYNTSLGTVNDLHNYDRVAGR
jgi:hypothetical protein